MLDFGFARLYCTKRDWAGIGRKHRMLAWSWHGTPRSIVL